LKKLWVLSRVLETIRGVRFNGERAAKRAKPCRGVAEATAPQPILKSLQNAAVGRPGIAG